MSFLTKKKTKSNEVFVLLLISIIEPFDFPHQIRKLNFLIST